mmetsp:Transcript_16730/g.33365  ORF Transcript_16730/g.33365 Transcript_16730/m.33365 type:complete len:306 (+) Transcript_16730:222-1139(+)
MSANSPAPASPNLFRYDAPGGDFIDLKAALERTCASSTAPIDPWFFSVHPSHFALSKTATPLGKPASRPKSGRRLTDHRGGEAAKAGRKMSTGGVRRVPRGATADDDDDDDACAELENKRPNGNNAVQHAAVSSPRKVKRAARRSEPRKSAPQQQQPPLPPVEAKVVQSGGSCRPSSSRPSAGGGAKGAAGKKRKSDPKSEEEVRFSLRRSAISQSFTAPAHCSASPFYRYRFAALFLLADRNLKPCWQNTTSVSRARSGGGALAARRSSSQLRPRLSSARLGLQRPGRRTSTTCSSSCSCTTPL